VSEDRGVHGIFKIGKFIPKDTYVAMIYVVNKSTQIIAMPSKSHMYELSCEDFSV